MCSQVHTHVSAHTFTLSAGGGASGGCLALTLTHKVWPLVQFQPALLSGAGGLKVPGHQASPAQRLVRWRSHSCAPPCARGIATVVTVLLSLWGLGPRGLSTREGQAEPASPLSTSWSQGGCAPGVQGVSPTVYLGRPCLSLTPKFFLFPPYLLLPCLPPCRPFLSSCSNKEINCQLPPTPRFTPS